MSLTQTVKCDIFSGVMCSVFCPLGQSLVSQSAWCREIALKLYISIAYVCLRVPSPSGGCLICVTFILPDNLILQNGLSAQPALSVCNSRWQWTEQNLQSHFFLLSVIASEIMVFSKEKIYIDIIHKSNLTFGCGSCVHTLISFKTRPYTKQSLCLVFDFSCFVLGFM